MLFYEYYASLEGGRMYNWGQMLVAFDNHASAVKYKKRFQFWNVLLLYKDEQDRPCCRLVALPKEG